MIQIKPLIQSYSNCPHCKTKLIPNKILWQGMHVCAESECPSCNAKIIEDLNVGHAVSHPYQVDVNQGLVFGDKSNQEWLGSPLIKSLQNPQSETLKITKEVFKQYNKVIILNCIDFLYGHCLLKLLNAEKHLQHNPDYGLVVIVQKFMRWMVPDEVSEVWTVDIPLRQGQLYYPSFNNFIQDELQRFTEVYVSKAHSHPSEFDITNFTTVKKHDFNKKEFRITFVWREDRIWCKSPLWGILRRLNLINIALIIQNREVEKLFKFIKSQIPTAKFTVTGLGRQTTFPDWIEDLRVENFDEKKELTVCQIYSESRLVIGVHGSNMLLPSAHAGMTIDLMPNERWGNFAQDILYQESDPRIASFQYRYLPIKINLIQLGNIALSMLCNHAAFLSRMTAG